MLRFVHRPVLALTIVVVAAASLAWAEGSQKPWSQTEVLALTEQLSTALDELLADPGLREPQSSVYQQRNYDAAIATVKRVEPRVADLRRRLASGSDLDGSRPYFDLVAELREEIAAYAEETWLADSTRDKVRHVRELFGRLARYYQ
jgi:hypothetical protein